MASLLLFSCSVQIIPEQPPEITNCILIIGDGMGFAHVRAASLYLTGEEDGLSFQQFPAASQVGTLSLCGATTDSAAAATAMATGMKVSNGTISQAPDGKPYETLLEYYKRYGMSTGLVSTAHLTHATPAAFGAHEESRGNYKEIAADFLEETQPAVLLGGGANGLTPEAAEAAGYEVVTTAAELQAALTNDTQRISGQFGTSHIPYVAERSEDYPSLTTMTEAALSILEQDPDGFFLMVEAGRIDHASHDNNLVHMIGETIELHETVEAIKTWATGREDTVIIVTADHETGLLDMEIPITEGSLPTNPDAYWGHTGHSRRDVPIYVWGMNAEQWDVSSMDNTDIYKLITNTF